MFPLTFLRYLLKIEAFEEANAVFGGTNVIGEKRYHAMKRSRRVIFYLSLLLLFSQFLYHLSLSLSLPSFTSHHHHHHLAH